MRLADADASALVQGAEADRRRVQYACDLEVVNDGGPWCWRLTRDYYPEAIAILDWAHAAGHVKVVAEAAPGAEMRLNSPTKWNTPPGHGPPRC